jgi:restriction system protein
MIKYWWVFLPVLAGLIYWAKLQYRYSMQNRGEQIVTNAIMNHLPAGSWHLMNNITLPLDKGTTQIDHILVSTYGIFVIETKHYSGWIFGDEKSKQWTQVMWQVRSRFQNPLHQNYKHVKAVRELLDFLPPESIIGMVVFTGDAQFKTPVPIGIYNLTTAINTLKAKGNEVLSENRMQFSVGRIECKRLALTRQTDIEHRAHINSR